MTSHGAGRSRASMPPGLAHDAQVGRQRYLRYPEMSTLLGGVSRTTLWRWSRSTSKVGLPKPRRLGPNTVAWSELEVIAWLESRDRAQ